MKNIQNERAAFAYEKVKKVMSGKNNAEFFSIARSAPAEVQMSGLSTMAAMLYSKKSKEAHAALYEIIYEWLKIRKLTSETELIDAIIQADIIKYQLMTNETQQLLVWVKRFAEGMKQNGEEK